jgi:hypothetical protein
MARATAAQRLVLALGLALALAPPRVAANTKWTVQNDADRAVHVECESPETDVPLYFHTVHAVAPGGQYAHRWHGWYHNDGLGLNPGVWRCAAGDSSSPLTEEGTRVAEFVTDWGEELRLVVGKDLAVAKAAPPK